MSTEESLTLHGDLPPLPKPQVVTIEVPEASQVYKCRECDKETVHVHPTPVMLPEHDNLDDAYLCDTCGSQVKPIKGKTRLPRRPWSEPDDEHE